MVWGLALLVWNRVRQCSIERHHRLDTENLGKRFAVADPPKQTEGHPARAAIDIARAPPADLIGNLQRAGVERDAREIRVVLHTGMGMLARKGDDLAGIDRDRDRLVRIDLFQQAGDHLAWPDGFGRFAAPPDPDLVSHAMTIRVPDCRAAYRSLLARGPSFLAPPYGWGGEIRCFLRDPDGPLFEISEAR